MFQARVAPEIGFAVLLMLLTFSAAVQLICRSWRAPVAADFIASAERVNNGSSPSRKLSSRSDSIVRRGSSPGKGDSALLPSEVPPVALNSMLGDNSPGAEDSFRETVREWAETNPSAAAAWVGALGRGSRRSSALQQVAIAWADKDLQAAASWLHSLPADESRPDAVLAFAYEAARTDPRAALTEAGALAPTPERNQALLHAVSQWSVSDSSSALAWSMQVPDAALRLQLISAVAVAAADSSPQTAAKLVALALEAGPQQETTAVAVIQRWAESAPEAAADWVLQFPDTPARMAAAQNLAVIWAERDPAGLQKWASNLPPGPLQEVALRPYDEALARHAAN
jgi:hypothetical protein